MTDSLRDARRPRRLGTRIRQPARSCRRFIWRPPTRRTQPGRARRRLRVQPVGQSDPRRARSRARRSRRRARTGSRSPADWPPRTACCARCRPARAIVIPHDAYGGTFRLVARVHAEHGLRFDAVDLGDPAASNDAITDDTAMVWCESPTNPTLATVDIAAVAAAAHDVGAARRGRQHVRHAVPPAAALDWAPTSSCTRPPSISAATPTSSAAPSLLNDDALAERIGFLQNAVGAVPAPFDCWLVLRGIRTLAVRVERQQENAQRVAAYLETERRTWPRCCTPASAGWCRSCTPAARTARSTRAHGRGCSRWPRASARSESLIEHPARMTHASVAGTTNEVDASLVRLSCGIEAADDLIADLAQAL